MVTVGVMGTPTVRAGNFALRTTTTIAWVECQNPDAQYVLIEALRRRGWDGDAELVEELEHRVEHTSSDLVALPVGLAEVGERAGRDGQGDDRDQGE